MNVRLIDLEGRTVRRTITVKTPPPSVLEVPVASRLLWRGRPTQPVEPTMRTIIYRLERIDGGGTPVYRRETGPWG